MMCILGSLFGLVTYYLVQRCLWGQEALYSAILLFMLSLMLLLLIVYAHNILTCEKVFFRTSAYAKLEVNNGSLAPNSQKPCLQLMSIEISW